MEHRITRRRLCSAFLGSLALAPLAGCAGLRRLWTPQPFTFVQLCDTQLGFGGYDDDVARFEQAVRQINALRPDFVTICGDLVNQADDPSFADFNRIKARFEMPCHCVSGNHDVGNAPTPASLERYRRVVGDDQYAFECHGCTFVVVNTQLWKAPVEGESERQDAWLAETLRVARADERPVFILAHYPLFLAAPDEEEEYFNLPLDKRSELLALFEASGVVAVLGGHTHRFIVNDYRAVQLLNGETTSRNFDGRPFGFRTWDVDPAARSAAHTFVALEMPSSPPWD